MDAAFWGGLGCVGGLVLFFAVGIILLTWSTGELAAMAKRWIDKR